MSVAIDKLGEIAGEALVGACWTQWRSVQASGRSAPDGLARSIVDPEALVLASLVMRTRERRLQDVLLWWIERGVRLNSVQRLRTVLSAFPPAIDAELRWFAGLAVEAGDPRWKPLSSKPVASDRPRAGKDRVALRLLEPCTVMLRLRAGLGVGAKADLIAFLIGMQGRSNGEAWIAPSLLGDAVGYSRTSIHRATTDLVLARFIEESAATAPMHHLDLPAWIELLDLRERRGAAGSPAPSGSDVPAWRHWSAGFAFLACTHAWTQADGTGAAARVVQASHARDLVQRFERFFVWNRITPVGFEAYPGPAFLGRFEEIVVETTDWMKRHL